MESGAAESPVAARSHRYTLLSSDGTLKQTSTSSMRQLTGTGKGTLSGHGGDFESDEDDAITRVAAAQGQGVSNGVA